jgi:hypothetical protein
MPVFDARVDTLLREEELAILVPRPHALGRTADRLDDLLLVHGLLEQSPEPSLVDAVLRVHLRDEGLEIRPARIERGGGRRNRERGRDDHDGAKSDHAARSLRCVCTDMSIPKPASMVTIEVPP